MGNPIVSLPVKPARPQGVAAYDEATLYLFKTWTRATYLAAFGVQAPPYDPARPLQAWFDTSANPGPYKAIAGSGDSARLEALPVPVDVAVPNLPGGYAYPAWDDPKTTAAVVGFAGGAPLADQALVHLICTQAEAQTLAKMWGGPAPVEYTSLEMGVQGWNGETRRMWQVVSPQGQLVLAKGFLEQMYERGVDPVYGPPPGKWGLDAGNPQWQFTEDPAWAGLPTVPVPCDDLLPTEKLASTMLGMGTQIVNSALLPSAPAEGGGYTQKDRDLANSTHVMVLEIARALGQPVPSS